MINQTAVDNFLFSMDMNMKMMDHVRNAHDDMVVYGWNVKTYSAIVEGIKQKYREKSICTYSNGRSRKP